MHSPPNQTLGVDVSLGNLQANPQRRIVLPTRCQAPTTSIHSEPDPASLVEVLVPVHDRTFTSVPGQDST